MPRHPTSARLLAATLIGLLIAPGAVRAQDKAEPPRGAIPPAADRAGGDKGEGDKDKPGGKGAGEGKAVDTADDGLYSCEKAKGRFKINLPADIELKDLVTWAFSFTCKNFIYASDVAGRVAKVTIKSPEAMTAQQAWKVFLVALRSMGLAVVPKGNILQIVEESQAKDKPLPIFTKGGPGATDELVRVVLRPDNLTPDDLATVLTELKSQNGNVKAVPRAGVVLVTDYGSNVARMSQLMLAVDQSVAGERLYIVRAKYADATELVTSLNEILGLGKGDGGEAPPQQPTSRAARRRAEAAAAKGEAPPEAPPSADAAVEVEAAVPSKLIADARTNSIIMLGSEPAFLRVKALIGRLDVSLDVEGGGSIHVYPLENADAEQLGTTLQAVISGITQTQTQGQAQPGGRNRAPAPAPAGDAGGLAFEGQVRVTHDKPSNSLVIVSSVKDFRAVREVIRKLDAPRPQVYIEASIVEISVSNSRELGVSFHGGVPFGEGDDNLLVAGSQQGSLSSLQPKTLAALSGLVGGAIGAPLAGAQEILGVGTSIPSFGLLFQALAKAGLTNVLSSPHLLTKDNEIAKISVGENIPYQSALVNLGAAGAGSAFPTQSIQRQDIALTLEVTPHIGASDMVSLDIKLEISDRAGSDPILGPSWAKRTFENKITVKDQQAYALGGLVSDKVSSTESKVPLLGDIPLLGYLFKYTTKTKEKRNLLVVMTPFIIKDSADLERIKERRTREQREFMASYSAFAKMKYQPEIDYRRKRGLVDQMDRAVKKSEEEARILEDLQRQEIGFPDGPIDYSAPAREPGAEPTELPAEAAPGPVSPATPDVDARATKAPRAATAGPAKAAKRPGR